MKKVVFSGLLTLMVLLCSAQSVKLYKTLDPKRPIVFGGDHIIYKGQTIKLGPKSIFIDGQLTEDEAARYSFVYNSVNKAAEHLTDGTEESPMMLYIAPYVYWIDNPDDPAIRVGENGAPPYGKIMRCEWLRFHGLTDKPEHVVLASNRGQTIGAQGNFTMFKFIGQGTGSENVTFGNYCNIDLVYPLLPKLGRQKRSPAIVQAQLIHCNGDKILARNTRFVSRLNLCPFVGGKRVLFDRCHFESTDDALCGTGVYLNCSLDFYGSKPFYNTSGTGAVLLNCDIRSFTGDRQYFTKANGQVAVLDSRFKTNTATYVGWQDVIPSEMRNYQYNVLLNGKPLFISKNEPGATVDMSAKPVVHAYRLVHNGKVVYNTYNLLSGNDDWDPMGVKEVVLAAAKASNQTYTKVPVQLLVSPTKVSVETAKSDVELTAKAMRFGNYASGGETVNWSVAPEYSSLVQLKVSNDGSTCKVIPTNTNDETKTVVVTAFTSSGLEAASEIRVAPSILPAPLFSSRPGISRMKNEKLRVNYKLDAPFKDQSLISWYRCTDAKGSDAIEVAVSRFDTPLLEYALSPDDIGYFLMASVAPKHIRSKAGEPVHTITEKPITEHDVKTTAHILFTDFRNTSTRNQPRAIPGFWTWDHFDPPGVELKNTTEKKADAWYYGEGSDGAANMRGLLQGRSASMRYTPRGDRFGDMKLSLTVAPFKTAGQGFSVAHLYMDVLIKFDTRTSTGYGLRFIRTTKYHDAVDCIFVSYENGKVVPVGEPLSTTAFKTPCKITVEVKQNRILAHAATEPRNNMGARRPGVAAEVKMETRIVPNPFGGVGIQYNGGSPTLIKDFKVEWK